MLVAIRSMIGELVRLSHTVLLRSPLCSVVRALRGLLSTLPATRLDGFASEVPRSSAFAWTRWASFENIGKKSAPWDPLKSLSDLRYCFLAKSGDVFRHLN